MVVAQGPPLDALPQASAPAPDTTSVAPSPTATSEAAFAYSSRDFEVVDWVLISGGGILLIILTYTAWKFAWLGVYQRKGSLSETEAATGPGKPRPALTTYSLPVSVIHAMNGITGTQKISTGNVFNHAG
ncbi:hypothetical protein K493DRAFT_317647 [Basidiobolus meristosporus CBS 931.73]|uniref:Uncharacterized protein n=1 Tax=Basidiobolus meristosporus CBS 931.73 TaxID=1314790 RepID=A0A1Y1XYV0_9FUNG|nr:hypothetical protein K493DRAFT_317647 [Basidiobolus meristosporus CBS 931.73]|eukprot:ORX90918.1 hypothetical protein K493DRAFT_317647 [Basidiobolus meristosporus CBS 931.73]